MTSLFEKLGADILARMFEVAAHGLALIDVEGRFLHLNAVGCGMLGGEREALLTGPGCEIPLCAAFGAASAT